MTPLYQLGSDKETATEASVAAYYLSNQSGDQKI
jgi:hypothetical protein